MVYLGKIQPDSPLQVDMCKTKKAFELLKMKGVSIDIVDQCADMFKLCFNAEKRNRLKEFLFQLKMEHPFDDACELFMFIIKRKFLMSGVKNLPFCYSMPFWFNIKFYPLFFIRITYSTYVNW